MDSMTIREMRALDANAVWFGTPVSELMENAGRAVAEEAGKLGSSFVIVCGSGNNGGDGFAAARHLKSKPRIFYLWKPKSAESQDNFEKAKNYRPAPLNENNLSELEKALSECDVVIDAIFGTGLRGRINTPAREAILLMNKAAEAGKKVVSVDAPSGMDPDTGKVEDVAVKPTVTVCLHAAKKGLVGNKAAGKIIVAGIGIPKKAETHVGKGDFKYSYPRRKDDAHKGGAGRVLVVGGSKEYTGAPYFTAMAALRAGCDLSYVAAPEEPAERIAVLGPDLIVYPLKSEYILSKPDVKAVLGLLPKADVLCIGNGMGADPKSVVAAKAVITAAMKAKKTMVIDGDGLKAAKSLLLKLGGNAVLTPHAGEFKTLFGLEANEESLKKAAKKCKCIILLKGYVDMIAQNSDIKYNSSGNPYMSKGGTGDVLAGLCSGFLAQGVTPFNAACFAALVNGVAGDIAYSEKSIALTASDVLDCVPMAERILLE